MSTKVMIQLIADYFKTQPVLKAWIFGSFARGEETEDSDLDILVEYDKNARISLLTISHMMGELEKSTGRRIDLIEDGCLLPFAVESANRDKVLIYERSNGRNMSAEFSAHINSLQNNHKFPMIVMDCQEFLH